MAGAVARSEGAGRKIGIAGRQTFVHRAEIVAVGGVDGDGDRIAEDDVADSELARRHALQQKRIGTDRYQGIAAADRVADVEGKEQEPGNGTVGTEIIAPQIEPVALFAVKVGDDIDTASGPEGKDVGAPAAG